MATTRLRRPVAGAPSRLSILQRPDPLTSGKGIGACTGTAEGVVFAALADLLGTVTPGVTVWAGSHPNNRSRQARADTARMRPFSGGVPPDSHEDFSLGEEVPIPKHTWQGPHLHRSLSAGGQRGRMKPPSCLTGVAEHLDRCRNVTRQWTAGLSRLGFPGGPQLRRRTYELRVERRVLRRRVGSAWPCSACCVRFGPAAQPAWHRAGRPGWRWCGAGRES